MVRALTAVATLQQLVGVGRGLLEDGMVPESRPAPASWACAWSACSCGHLRIGVGLSREVGGLAPGRGKYHSDGKSLIQRVSYLLFRIMKFASSEGILVAVCTNAAYVPGRH
jgi:hypothetical protein